MAENFITVETPPTGLIRTFNGFFDILNMDLMNDQIKEQLVRSMGIVFSRSKEGESHQSYLKEQI